MSNDNSDYIFKCKRCGKEQNRLIELLEECPVDFCSKDCFNSYREFEDYKVNKDKYNKI